MTILKEEINQLAGEIFDLAKWKLIAVGAFALVGLGWDEIKPGEDTGIFLLYSVGYLCIYTDSLYYRRATAIHVIAQYLRNYAGTDAGMKELCLYEIKVQENRVKGRLFVSDRWPQFIASLVFATGLPVVGMLRYERDVDALLFMPATAVVITVALFISYNCHRSGRMEPYNSRESSEDKCISVASEAPSAHEEDCDR